MEKLTPQEYNDLLDLLWQLTGYYEQPCYYDNTPKEEQESDKDKLYRMISRIEDLA